MSKPIYLTNYIEWGAEGEERFSANTQVHFAVAPPYMDLASDQGGGTFRAADSEGVITVNLLKDGSGIEVRGRHAIQIEPHGSNSVTIRLLDSKEVRVRRSRKS